MSLTCCSVEHISEPRSELPFAKPRHEEQECTKIWQSPSIVSVAWSTRFCDDIRRMGDLNSCKPHLGPRKPRHESNTFQTVARKKSPTGRSTQARLQSATTRSPVTSRQGQLLSRILAAFDIGRMVPRPTLFLLLRPCCSAASDLIRRDRSFKHSGCVMMAKAAGPERVRRRGKGTARHWALASALDLPLWEASQD